MADENRDQGKVEADRTRSPEPQETPKKGKAKVVASTSLNSLVKAQAPRGAIGRVRGEDADPRKTRPGALPVPHKRNVSAFTPAPVIDRWNAEAAGVRAVEMDDNVITMFGMIGEDFWTGEGVTAKRTTAQLRAIGGRPVEVHINSFGGDMFEGIAIFNVLREHPYDVTIKVMGIAASAASIIAMAGNRVEVGSASFIMIHNCSVMGGGNRHDFLELAAFLEPFDRALADVYAERTGLDAKVVSRMMDDETYMSGSVAVEKGFADGIMPADRTRVDDKARATDRSVNELRAMELQLVASGMTRNDARARIKNIKGTPGAAPEGDTPGAVEDLSLIGDLAALTAILRS